MSNYERFCYTYNAWIAAKNAEVRCYRTIEQKYAEYALARDLYFGFIKLPDLIPAQAFS